MPDKKPTKSIIFVYNADSGLSNALLDYGKKYLSPSRYDCQLCMVSYGPFGMKKEWKRFVSKLPYPVSFLHKDELVSQFPSIKTSYPAMLLIEGGNFTVLLDHKDFSNITTLNSLQTKVQEVLSKLG